MPTIDIPGIGNVEKKYVYISAAGIAGFAGFMYWRSRQAGSDPTADAAVDPAATDAGPTADAGTFDPSAYSYDYSGSAPTYQAPVNQVIPVTSDQQITTDAAWDAAAIAQAGDIGADPSALSSALGRFLANLCLSNAQADLVRQAQGLLGRPPQSPNLQVHICTTSGGGSSTYPAGKSLPGPTSLHGAAAKGAVNLAWHAVSGAAGYRVYGEYSSSNVGSTASTSFHIGGLGSKKTHHFHVRAVGHDGVVSDHKSSTIAVKTK